MTGLVGFRLSLVSLSMAAAEVAPVPEASGFYAGAGGLSTGRKLVPWSSWAEWSFVRDDLFSPFPAAALRRVTNTLLPIAREGTVPIFSAQGCDFSECFVDWFRSLRGGAGAPS